MKITEIILESETGRTEDFAGLKMHVRQDAYELIVSALDGDWGAKELGYVVMRKGDGNELEADDLMVFDKYRGQGIAKAMYDYIKSKGFKIMKSPDVTQISDQGKESGEHFWQKNRGEETVWEEINPQTRQADFKDQREINGLVYSADTEVEEFKGHTYTKLHITVRNNRGERLGYAWFTLPDNDAGAMTCSFITVPDQHQKKGIATTMYAYARKLGNSIERSTTQLGPGRDMWTAWDKSGFSKELAEVRSHPDQNKKHWNAQGELESWFHSSGLKYKFKEQASWGVSMTILPKLGINPNRGVSEDTPKGIYFYPLSYMIPWMYHNRKELPWGNDFPYIQLFQYDNSHQLTQKTPVDPAQLKAALSQYCPPEVIENTDYDGDAYWFIYNCLVQVSKNDESTIVRWNKVLRLLGFTSVMDQGRGWIATNEPYQGIILDPRIIKQVKTFDNYARKGDPRPPEQRK